MTTFGPLWGGGVPPGRGRARKFLQIFSKKKFVWSKNTFYGFPGPKNVFLSKYFFAELFFLSRTNFGPLVPGKPPGRAAGGPKRYFGPKNGYTGSYYAIHILFY